MAVVSVLINSFRDEVASSKCLGDEAYRGTSPISKRPSLLDPVRTLDICLQ